MGGRPLVPLTSTRQPICPKMYTLQMRNGSKQIYESHLSANQNTVLSHAKIHYIGHIVTFLYLRRLKIYCIRRGLSNSPETSRSGRAVFTVVRVCSPWPENADSAESPFLSVSRLLKLPVTYSQRPLPA